MTAAATTRRSAGSSSERSPSSFSRELSFSKTLSSADAFNDVKPEELSPEKLEEVLALLQKANFMLRLENEIFQDKLSRENPDLLTGLSAIIEEEVAATRKPSAVPAAPDAVEAVVPARSATHSPQSRSHTTTPSRSAEPDDAQDVRDAHRSRVVLSTASASDTLSAGNARLAAIRAKASTKTSKAGSLDRVPRMSFSQRMDIAEEAAYMASQRAGTLRSRGEAAAADLRARTEEALAQLLETRAARHTLDNLDTSVVATQDGDVGSGRTYAEKFQRYMHDWIKQLDTTVDKIRLKISSLRAHHKRIKADIAVKRELGEALRPVDFDKIQIEIDEYNRKIDKKTKHLIELKNISGDATSRLLASKKRLSDLNKHLQGIRKETATKRSQIAALEREEQKVLEDVARADMALNAVRVRMERQTAPDVLDYVRLKQDLDVLRRDAVVWERRCKIQHQTARELRRTKELCLQDQDQDEHGAGQGQASPARGSPRAGRAPAHQDDVGHASDTTTSSERRPSSAKRRKPRPRRRRSQSRTQGATRGANTSSSSMEEEESPSAGPESDSGPSSNGKSTE